MGSESTPSLLYCSSLVEIEGLTVPVKCGERLYTAIHDERVLLCPNCDMPARCYGAWLRPRLVPAESTP